MIAQMRERLAIAELLALFGYDLHQRLDSGDVRQSRCINDRLMFTATQGRVLSLQ